MTTNQGGTRKGTLRDQSKKVPCDSCGRMFYYGQLRRINIISKFVMHCNNCYHQEEHEENENEK